MADGQATYAKLIAGALTSGRRLPDDGIPLEQRPRDRARSMRATSESYCRLSYFPQTATLGWGRLRRERSLPGVEERSRPRPRGLSELGRLLAAANGYAVVDAGGRQVGRVDRVRYERHTDRPDEVVVRRGWLRKRELVVSLEAIEAVDRATGTIRLRRLAPSG